MAMKILLISPASGPWRGISERRLFNGKTFRFSMLSLLTVAELSPDDAEVRIVDEQIEPIADLDEFADRELTEGGLDVVGVTAMTAAAPRAYEIARCFRERGVPVVMGGFHATLNPEEALGYVDAVVAGSAFGAWPKVLDDLLAGGLGGIYHGNPRGEIPATLPRHLVDRSDYVTVNSTYATLGCKNSCKFCSIAAFHGGERHHRAVADVVREVSGFEERFFMFVDDNLTQDREYVVELLGGLRPLKKEWITQVSIEVAEDEALLGLMRDAGCIGLFIGLETFDDRALDAQDKGFNAPMKYAAAVDRVHRHGMFVEAGIVFGFDTDILDVFRATLAALDRIGIDAIQASILTPLPGTPLYDSMADRLVDTDWEHYDYRHAVFVPRRMNTEQLQAGADWVIRDFYSLRRILKRSLRWLLMPRGFRLFLYPLALNLAYYGRVKSFNIRGHDPAAATAPSRRRHSRARGIGLARRLGLAWRVRIARRLGPAAQ
jgi:radical SAM superfamily enzyme YgiQ (UPF0313 family)